MQRDQKEKNTDKITNSDDIQSKAWSVLNFQYKIIFQGN